MKEKNMSEVTVNLRQTHRTHVTVTVVRFDFRGLGWGPAVTETAAGNRA